MSGFVFCACQPGAERMLKREVHRVFPGWRPAYARPGLVTFKGEAAIQEDELVFARVTGRSLSTVRTVAAAARAAREVGARRLHLWDRTGEPVPPDLREAILRAAELPEDERPRRGELVLDVIVAEGDAWFVGTHVHRRGRSPYAGGLYPVDLPEDAPSRAYRKLEEALLWSGARPRAGEVAVEVGSAPGGASHALLRRGLEVVGIDPGEMAEVVARHPRFRHLRMAIGAVRREQLPRRADWLLLDVNLAPQVALHALRRIVAMLRGSLRGAILTLKMNEEAFVDEIPGLLARLREMGLRDARATQLPSNRREICVAGRFGL
jgi:23S rRNA (cytidine2498-2'-O)-methyltransferase